MPGEKDSGSGRERHGSSPESRSPAAHPVTAVSNASLGRLLQRDDWGLRMRPPPPIGVGPGYGIDPSIIAGLEKARQERKAKIVAYLDKDREAHVRNIKSVMTSLPELVDRVRRNVPEARDASIFELEQVVKEWSPVPVPVSRQGWDVAGLEKELKARISINLPDIPTEIEIKRSFGSIKVSVKGVETTVPVGPVALKGEVTTGGDKSVGFETSVGPLKFAAKVDPTTIGNELKWEMQLGFPETESMVPLFAKLPEVFSEANSAIVKAAGEMRAGVPLGEVKKNLEPVKAALEAFSAIKAFKGAAFGVKVEGEGANVKVLATVTVRF